MKRLQSNSDLIRTTGSVSPYCGYEDASAVAWLNDLPYNSDASATDVGVYITIQGVVTTEISEQEVDYLFMPNFEIFSKWTDKNGNPCFLVRDIRGFNSKGAIDNPSDLQWLYYDSGNQEVRISAIDPTN